MQESRHERTAQMPTIKQRPQTASSRTNAAVQSESA
jgi:hypothetical protein